MTSCITVAMQTETAPAPDFVTSTLPATKIMTPRPSSTSSPILATDNLPQTIEAKCENGAVLLEDVMIPDNSNVPAGKVFTKTWKLKNTGTCPWTGYSINYASGERMNAPASAQVPETPAGGIVDLSVDLTAPAGNGTYTIYFVLQSPAGESVPIGTEQTFYAKIVIGTGSAPAFIQSTSALQGVPAISIGTMNINCKYMYSENTVYVQQLASLINQVRADSGLTTLVLNPILTQAAQAHSADMACNDFLGHESSDGSFFGAFVRAVGYPNSFQEIIAIGTPQDAMDQWLADSGHWEIVLNANVTEMGVGYAYNSNSQYGGYFTVDIH